jgi:glycolate oxidase
MLSEVSKIAEKFGLEIATFGHAGDGNLHPTMLVDRRNNAEMKKVKLAMKELFEVALSRGGTLSGEHGIGLSKKAFMKLEHGNTLDLMKNLKTAFDPKNIMNPGKIF